MILGLSNPSTKHLKAPTQLPSFLTEPFLSLNCPGALVLGAPALVIHTLPQISSSYLTPLTASCTVMALRFVCSVQTSYQRPWLSNWPPWVSTWMSNRPHKLMARIRTTDLFFSQITFLHQPPVFPTSNWLHHSPRFIPVSLYTLSFPWSSPFSFISKKYPETDLFSIHSPMTPTLQFCPFNTLGWFPTQGFCPSCCFCLGHPSLKQSCIFSFTQVWTLMSPSQRGYLSLNKLKSYSFTW